jgi:UDPglucose 6-dehydrogenase
VSADIAEATDRVNRRQAEHLAGLALAHLSAGGRVAVLGLTYKPGTHVVEEAAGVALAAELARRGARVTVHDPRGAGAAHATLGGAVTYAPDVVAAVGGAEVVVITTPWPDYRGVARISGPHTVIDCWRCTDGAGAAVNVIHPGTHAATRVSARSAAA